MQLPQDFREFIALMISTNVKFVMIGGYAYNLYLDPRATGDIDFLVSADSANEGLIRRVLTDFGFGTTLPSVNEPILVEGRVLMLGRSPMRIDLLTKIDGVSFEEVKGTCRRVEIDGLLVPVISPELLLKNKIAAGRPKDIADADELKALLEARPDRLI